MSKTIDPKTMTLTTYAWELNGEVIVQFAKPKNNELPMVVSAQFTEATFNVGGKVLIEVAENGYIATSGTKKKIIGCEPSYTHDLQKAVEELTIKKTERQLTGGDAYDKLPKSARETIDMALVAWRADYPDPLALSDDSDDFKLPQPQKKLA